MLPVGSAWLTVMCDAGSHTARWAGPCGRTARVNACLSVARRSYGSCLEDPRLGSGSDRRVARQRFRKVFRTRFPGNLRQPFSVSGHAIAEQVWAPEIIVRTFGSTQKKVHRLVRLPGPKTATKRSLWIEPERRHQILFLAGSPRQQVWRLSPRPWPLGQAVSSG